MVTNDGDECVYACIRRKTRKNDLEMNRLRGETEREISSDQDETYAVIRVDYYDRYRVESLKDYEQESGELIIQPKPLINTTDRTNNE